MSEAKKVTIDVAQGLYVIPCGDGYSCLGFEVCEKRRRRLAEELRGRGVKPPSGDEIGSMGNYDAHKETSDLAYSYHKETGYRFTCELHPKLVGREHISVQITRPDGSKSRFRVGKSTGWVPCHLACSNVRSIGGDPIEADEEFSVSIVKRKMS